MSTHFYHYIQVNEELNVACVMITDYSIKGKYYEYLKPTNMPFEDLKICQASMYDK